MLNNMHVVLSALVLLLVSLPAMSRKSEGYADSWAVGIAGGEAKAKELAEKHGVVYRGQVSHIRQPFPRVWAYLF